MRGTRPRYPRHGDCRRFIPACAGNTAQLWPQPARPAVHPRVCGEHTAGITSRLMLSGSSPRVRGTRPPISAKVWSSRFIPACAGNTRPSQSATVRMPVHPRVCGEHLIIPPTIANVPGSSPRVRGTPTARARQPKDRRFIPACAGNTPNGVRSFLQLAVHPRVCGEHFQIAGGEIAPVGSSPRVRGTPSGSGGSRSGGRFIPACAGNTQHSGWQKS